MGLRGLCIDYACSRGLSRSEDFVSLVVIPNHVDFRKLNAIQRKPFRLCGLGPSSHKHRGINKFHKPSSQLTPVGFGHSFSMLW
jgi:hypothetical protein